MSVERQITLAEAALAGGHRTVALLSRLAELKEESGAHDEAAAHWEEASALEPGDPDLQHGWARALAHAGRRTESGELAARTLREHPDHFRSLHTLVARALRHERLEEAVEALDRSLARVPGNAAALGLKVQLLWELGRAEGATALLAPDQLVAVEWLPLPEGFETLDEFNSTLEASIQSNPGLHFEPRGLSTRGGLQTPLDAHGPRIEATLFRIVMQRLAQYRFRAELTRHPFLAAAPEVPVPSMWTVILQGGGHQIAHMHPGGWVSAVYYVKVPPVGPADEGALVLGCADPRLGMKSEPEVRVVHPEPGMLVIFPSFHFHATVPTAPGTERICVAFDVGGTRRVAGSPVSPG